MHVVGWQSSWARLSMHVVLEKAWRGTLRGLRRGRASRQRELQSCSRILDSGRSTTWQKKGMGKLIQTTRPAQSHFQSQKPKCKCSSPDTASPEDCDGKTPVFASCEEVTSSSHNGCSKWAPFIDIRPKNHVDETPLCAACEGGHLLIAQWLIEVGAAYNPVTKQARRYRFRFKQPY